MTSWPAVVEHDRFHQRLADALGDAAVDLPFAEQVVHDLADVVDRGVAGERHHAGLRIDLDLADVAAVRIIRRLRRERAGGFQPDVELRRQHRRPVERLAPRR